MNFGKMEIVQQLSAFHDFQSFLEISTATTGAQFGKIDRSSYKYVHRLAYNASDGFDDGFPIDFKSTNLDIADCVDAIRNSGHRYDIMLVDPYHDYECSYRDIQTAFLLLNDNGVMVVHDCLPPSAGDIISPTYVPGAWCGVTFIAYVDFLTRHNISYQTIDCDYGCGVIRKTPARTECPHELRAAWIEARRNPESAFEFLARDGRELLNLETPSNFISALAGTTPAQATSRTT